MTLTPLNERPHALYRFFNPSGTLLYIGITANLPTRLHDHRDDKPWWTTVANITVQHYPDRETVLAAEKAAIIAEKPLHNITHNGGQPGGTPTPRPGTITEWTFHNRDHHSFHRTEPLWLTWEVRSDAISDNYYVDEITPEELWDEWVTREARDEDAETVFGPGAVRIYWYIEGHSVFEAAPYRDLRIAQQSHRRRHGSEGMTQILEWEAESEFLHHYTWPTRPGTRQRLQWTALPIVDKVWRNDHLPELHTHKGGFIQEATGWKPSALQPFVNIDQLAKLAGLRSMSGCAK